MLLPLPTTYYHQFKTKPWSFRNRGPLGTTTVRLPLPKACGSLHQSAVSPWVILSTTQITRQTNAEDRRQGRSKEARQTWEVTELQYRHHTASLCISHRHQQMKEWDGKQKTKSSKTKTDIFWKAYCNNLRSILTTRLLNAIKIPDKATCCLERERAASHCDCQTLNTKIV